MIPEEFRKEYLSLEKALNETLEADTETSEEEILKFWVAISAYRNTESKRRRGLRTNV